MILKACFFGLVFAFCGVLLKNLGWRGAPVFAAIGFLTVISELPSFFKESLRIFELWDSFGESSAAILKIIGTGYLFGISADICRELGEGGISTALTLAGRIEIIAISLPFISEIFSLAISLV